MDVVAYAELRITELMQQLEISAASHNILIGQLREAQDLAKKLKESVNEKGFQDKHHGAEGNERSHGEEEKQSDEKVL